MTTVLDRAVLVLNRSWQAVHTCSVRRALHLVCLGHAQIVQVDGDACYSTHSFESWIEYSKENDEGERVHGVSLSLRLPRVVVLALYDRLPRLEVKFTRRNVFVRDAFTCQYCAQALPESQLNLDHVIPRDKGGRTSWENIVTSCFCCNTRKANKLPHEANMHPLNHPRAPRWRPLYGVREQGHGHESWSRFLPEVRVA